MCNCLTLFRAKRAAITANSKLMWTKLKKRSKIRARRVGLSRSRSQFGAENRYESALSSTTSTYNRGKIQSINTLYTVRVLRIYSVYGVLGTSTQPPPDFNAQWNLQSRQARAPGNEDGVCTLFATAIPIFNFLPTIHTDPAIRGWEGPLGALTVCNAFPPFYPVVARSMMRIFLIWWVFLFFSFFFFLFLWVFKWCAGWIFRVYGLPFWSPWEGPWAAGRAQIQI